MKIALKVTLSVAAAMAAILAADGYFRAARDIAVVERALALAPTAGPAQPAPISPAAYERLRADMARENLHASLVLIGVVALVVTTLGIVLIGRPVRALIGVARRYASGDLDASVKLRQRDEIGELAGVMADMGRELRAAQRRADEESQGHLVALEQLRHADRLATVGKLTSALAHELGTPLSTISARARMIATRELSGHDATESARIIAAQSERMAGIIRQTLGYARRGEPQRQKVDLGQLVRQAFSLLKPVAARRQVALRMTSANGDRHVASVDPNQLLQVLTNLVTNGIQAMPAGGTVTVALASGHRAPPDGVGVEGEHVCIEVRDEGKGIPEENRRDIFDAFFTTKPPGEGTGLGLPIAQGIVRNHGGWMEVESTVGKGSCFKVCLPQEGSSCLQSS